MEQSEPADEPVIEERDTFMHYTHFNHSDCSDTHPQRDMANNPGPPSPVMVPSEKNEPELQPVVSLPQQGSVGQEEKSDKTVGGSETNVAQDKTGNGDTSVGVWYPRDQEGIADQLRVHMKNICRTLGQNN